MGPHRFTDILAFAGALTILASLGSCGAPEPSRPTRECTSLIWAFPGSADAEVRVLTSFDGWATPGRLMTRYDDGWHLLELDAPPGEHGYLVVDGGIRRLDKFNPLTTYRGAEEVSLLLAPDCSAPALRVDAIEADASGALTARATLLARPGGAALDPATVTAKIEGGPALDVARASADDGSIELRAKGLPRGKHTVVIEAADADGRAADPARAVAWVDPAMRRWEDGVLYQIVVDRFRGDGGVPLAPPLTPGSRAGGTLGGVRAEIERGTFRDLGVTALWLSPVYTNPAEPREGNGGHMFEGYHGYWPLDPRGVDDRIGGAEALTDLVRAAHAEGMAVLFDLVPNHVYELSPRFVDHAADGWFHDGPDSCVCGSPGCEWSKRIQTCWFAPYLPDVRWQHPDAMKMGVEDALWWVRKFDADGVRIDAVPMMPRAATRRFAAALRADAFPSRSSFILGEVFTAGGSNGIAEVRYHLGPYGLDSAFDFPLMWAIREAVAHGTGGFDVIEATLMEEEVALAGSGVLLGRILGNHDTTRFLSEAAGDAAGDPWSTPPAQPDSAEPYTRHLMALALIMSLPGLPTLYYGDEIGLAGGSDPDSRRVMPDEASLSVHQQGLLAVTRRLGRLRACAPALREGDRIPLVATAHTYGFVRSSSDSAPVIALFSTASEPASIPLFSTAVSPGVYADALTGDEVSVGVNGAPASVTIDPLSFKILIPAGSPCL
jgi:glycosidase